MGVKQGDFEANLKRADELASEAKKHGADIAVFPEMFLCGFDYKRNLEFLKTRGDAAEKGLRAVAEKNRIALCGSLPHLENGEEKPRNRMLFIGNDGTVLTHYDKTHLFKVFNEDRYVKAGDEVAVCDTPFGRAGFAICYDIRFPDLFVKMAKLGAKFVIISAAFPHPRMGHWRVLSKARAIENQYFVIAVNRGGEEDFGKPEGGVKYFGRSAAIDPWGEIIAECPENEADAISYADINLEEVDDIREKIPAFSDRRPDIY